MKKNTNLKLSLSKESLRRLTASDLGGIAGGATNNNGTERCSAIVGCYSYDTYCRCVTDSCPEG